MRGFSPRSKALCIVHTSALKAPLLKKKKKTTTLVFSSALGNALGCLGGKVENSWALGDEKGGGSYHLKSESGG